MPRKNTQKLTDLPDGLNGFWVPRLLIELMRKKIITATELLLVTEIAHLDRSNQGKGGSRYTNATYANLLGIGPNRIGEAISHLEEVGLVSRIGPANYKREVICHFRVDGKGEATIRRLSTEAKAALDGIPLTPRGVGTYPSRGRYLPLEGYASKDSRKKVKDIALPGPADGPGSPPPDKEETLPVESPPEPVRKKKMVRRSTPPPAAKKKPAAKTTWMSAYADTWLEAAGGLLSCAKYARDLKRMEKVHGRENLLVMWRAFCVDKAKARGSKESQYLAPGTFLRDPSKWDTEERIESPEPEEGRRGKVYG